MLDREKMFNERMEICKKCPLYKEDPIRGPICDSNKFISPDGTKWSWFKKDGYKRGCSCALKKALYNPNKTCVGGKW